MDEEWVCFKCKQEIDRVKEYCAFDEKGKRVHTSDCPIVYMEEERYQKEMMSQVFGAD